jgi:uncharacterized protein
LNSKPTANQGLLAQPTVIYIAPFIAFVSLMAIEKAIGLPARLLYPTRFVVVAALTWFLSRRVVSLRPSQPVLSILLGVAVFLIWVGPDVLFGYRSHWLFENALMGKAVSSLPAGLQADWLFIIVRVTSTSLLVPIVEELFWRGWMMRWLINVEFLKVPLGTYVPSAFWIVVLLFASEHGPYWEVGLITGILYNWWLVRTKNLADCILAHAVTNAILAGYVLMTGKWQYWL